MQFIYDVINFPKTHLSRQFLRFDVLPFVPIQADICIGELMAEEKRWLESYYSLSI